jgi:hypothetical protein
MSTATTGIADRGSIEGRVTSDHHPKRKRHDHRSPVAVTARIQASALTISEEHESGKFRLISAVDYNILTANFCRPACIK